MSQELGERLRRERLRRKELQGVTAERFGISQPNYSRWEAGEYRVGQKHMAAVAQFLGLSIEEVWTMANGDTPPTSLDLIREEIEALKRDVADLRSLVGKVGSLLEAVEAAVPGAKPKAKPAKKPVKRKPVARKAAVKGPPSAPSRRR